MAHDTVHGDWCAPGSARFSAPTAIRRSGVRRALAGNARRCVLPHLGSLLFVGSLIAACTTRDVGPNECGMSLVHVATIGGDRVDRAGIVLVTDDHILLVTNHDLSTIQVYDRRGRYLRDLGGPGDGPGEYRNILDLRQMEDGRVAVFDRHALRLTYLNQELEVLTTHPLPVAIWPYGAALLPGGDWAIAGDMIDRANFGSPVAVVTHAGELRRVFGSDETEKEGDRKGMMATRLIAHHPRHGVVTLKLHDYYLERWSADGQLVEVVSRDVPWFQWPPEWYGRPVEESGDRRRIGTRSPADQFLGVQFDSTGLLWVFAQVTPATWQEGVRDGVVVDHAAWTDFMVDVYDLDGGTEVCGWRIEDKYFFGGFAGPGIVKSYEEDTNGNPTLTLWKLAL